MELKGKKGPLSDLPVCCFHNGLQGILQLASQLSILRAFSEHQLHVKPCLVPREAVVNKRPCLKGLTVWWKRWRKQCPWVGLGQWREALRTVGAERPAQWSVVSFVEM